MKILLTITLTLTFIFFVMYLTYVYGKQKNNDPDGLDALLTVCAILFVIAIIFGSLTLAVWLVWR